MKKNSLVIIVVAIIVLIFGILYQVKSIFFSVGVHLNGKTLKQPPAPTERIEKIEIVADSTYGTLMESAGLDGQTSINIFNAAKDVYDLSKIRLGKTIDLVYDIKTDELKQLVYQIDTEDKLYVSKVTTTTDATSTPQFIWQAEIKPIDYEVKIKTAGGTVESSMYQAALDNNIDERAIIDLANVFQWDVDFAMDPRVGDTFKLIYEERYLDGQYVMPGRILAGKYVNDGTTYYAFYFKESDDNEGYFDENGNSVQKMFLKAPVAFKYISSGYTTGTRVVMEVGLVGPHRAIDYAAAYGTPIRTVGDGTVIGAGSNGCYGNMITIRHNATYTTRYAHQSKFAVKVGQKVKQGDVIGYVGSTGCSTGPHVHFEMIKNGVKVNSLKEILPPGNPIKDENKDRFLDTIQDLKSQLDQ
ncbi:MAG: peptidoglycan DD-metalloendopeptidase family protein [Candidatus Buchananbacteria bacterium]|nr:peptidoglycan DD-metalloendopeptidase family protein [Candidatus Buchananbacteria bacterium]